MYAPPMEDHSAYQSKMIVNMVVAVFLIVGILLLLQYFNFIFLKDVPVIGGWLMDLYEGVFGTPHILILHGEDSIGNWAELKNKLSSELVFYADEMDLNKFGSGMEFVLDRYGMVIVEDAKQLDKDKLMNIQSYVEGGGNLIWVGDAGTIGIVESGGNVLETQTGWVRSVVCIDTVTLGSCDCKKAKEEGSTCKYLPDSAEQEVIDMTSMLGVSFIGDVVGSTPELEIVDDEHWSAAGILRKVKLENVNKIASVENSYTTALVSNINMDGKAYPGIVVNDQPGSWGSVIYFAYPPEETMEILLPLIERLRY